MKKITILLLLFCHVGFSQTWQTIPIGFYSQLPLMYWEYGDSYMPKKQHFKINPFDNSIWGVSKSRVFRLDNNGLFQLWDENNVNLFYTNDFYIDMAFQPNKTFLLSRNTGLYQFNGNSWELISGQDDGQNLCTDADTLWMARSGLPYNFYHSSSMYASSYNGANRLRSKNGLLICSGDNSSGSLKNISNSNLYIYNSNIDSYYLGSQNYDFKFTSYSDTFYTSGNRGFSIAVNGVFVDTLTKYNTLNMPDLAITEFEFDSQGNIWAVFSPPSIGSLIYPEKIGYLNRTTNTWSQIYDGSNSPINFSNHRITIEVDTNDNLWVANGQNLHVLSSGSLPQWLNTAELNKIKPHFRVYPNPSAGKIQLETNFELEEIVVHDVLGNEVLKTHSFSEINLPKGIFVITAKNAHGTCFREKIVVE